MRDSFWAKKFVKYAEIRLRFPSHPVWFADCTLLTDSLVAGGTPIGKGKVETVAFHLWGRHTTHQSAELLRDRKYVQSISMNQWEELVFTVVLYFLLVESFVC